MEPRPEMLRLLGSCERRSTIRAALSQDIRGTQSADGWPPERTGDDDFRLPELTGRQGSTSVSPTTDQPSSCCRQRFRRSAEVAGGGRSLLLEADLVDEEA